MNDKDSPANVSASAFAGTAEDYARYRPPYPVELLDHLLARLAGRRRLLDLACGPGRIAIACAAKFEQVWAVDSEPDMVDMGKQIAGQQGLTNIRWHRTPGEDLDAPSDAFDLITIGEAFHRLDQVRVLQLARRWLRPGGWIASLGSVGILSGNEEWQLAVADLARKWTREVFPKGWATSRPGSAAGPEAEAAALRNAAFTRVSSHTFVQPRTWNIEEIAGYLRSTSVCSSQILGERSAAFEAAVRRRLLELDPSGQYRERMEFGYTAGQRPGGAEDASRQP
jgi:SAM-dependent methyltransferase